MRRTLLASYRCSWLIALAMIELNLALPHTPLSEDVCVLLLIVS
jgi:hypothetical protein